MSEEGSICAEVYRNKKQYPSAKEIPHVCIVRRDAPFTHAWKFLFCDVCCWFSVALSNQFGSGVKFHQQHCAGLMPLSILLMSSGSVAGWISIEKGQMQIKCSDLFVMCAGILCCWRVQSAAFMIWPFESVPTLHWPCQES